MSITLSVTADLATPDEQPVITAAQKAVGELMATPGVTVTSATATDSAGTVTNLLPEVDTPLQAAVDELAASINILTANPDGTYTVTAAQFTELVTAANKVEVAAATIPDVDTPPAPAAPPPLVGPPAAAAMAADAEKQTAPDGTAVAL